MNDIPRGETINTLDLMGTGGERRAVIKHNLEKAAAATLRLQNFFNNRGWDALSAEQIEDARQDFMMAARTRQRAEAIWNPLAEGLLESIKAQEAADENTQAPS